MLRLKKIEYNVGFGFMDTIKANILDDYSAKMSFDLERIIYASEDSPIIFKPYPYQINTIDNDNIIYTPDNQESFSEWFIGDTIHVYNAQGVNDATYRTATITDKINNATIRISPLSWTMTNEVKTEESTENHRCYIANASTPSNIKLRLKWLPTTEQDNYDEYISGHECAYYSTYPTSGSQTFTVMSLPVSIGTITVTRETTINNYKFPFYITISGKLTPAVLDGFYQYFAGSEDRQLFDGANSIDLLYGVELYSNASDNISNSGRITGLNIGGYNEQFNTGLKRYSGLGIQYYESGNIISSLSGNTTTNVTITYRVNNTTFDFLEKIRVHFILIPDSLRSMNINNFTQLQLLAYKSSNNITAEGVGSNGQVFVAPISVSMIDSQTVEITFNVNLGSDVKTALEAANGQYMFMVSYRTGNTYDFYEAETTIIDANVSQTILPTLALVESSTVYNLDPSPVDIDFQQSTTPNFFMTDNVEAISTIIIPKTDPIFVKKIETGVLAESTNKVVYLDRQTIAISNSIIDPDGYQAITANIIRGLNQSYKNVTKIQRETNMDDYYVHSLIFPFVVGSRTDKPLDASYNYPEFFNINAKNQGYTDDWFKYSSQSLWSTKYFTRLTYTYQGNDYIQTIKVPIAINNYSSNVLFTAKSINVYEGDTNNSLTISGVSYLKGRTRVEAIFDKATSFFARAYIYLAKKGDDGVRTSSTYTNTLAIVDAVIITMGTNSCKVVGYIDADNIGSDCDVYVRIFDKPVGLEETYYILTELGDIINAENGDRIEYEH